jgi:hypothetical protein
VPFQVQLATTACLFESLSFCNLSAVRHSRSLENSTVRKLDLFSFSGVLKETFTLLVPLERFDGLLFLIDPTK